MSSRKYNQHEQKIKFGGMLRTESRADKERERESEREAGRILLCELHTARRAQFVSKTEHLRIRIVE